MVGRHWSVQVDWDLVPALELSHYYYKPYIQDRIELFPNKYFIYFSNTQFSLFEQNRLAKKQDRQADTLDTEGKDSILA